MRQRDVKTLRLEFKSLIGFILNAALKHEYVPFGRRGRRPDKGCGMNHPEATGPEIVSQFVRRRCGLAWRRGGEIEALAGSFPIHGKYQNRM